VRLFPSFLPKFWKPEELTLYPGWRRRRRGRWRRSAGRGTTLDSSWRCCRNWWSRRLAAGKVRAPKHCCVLIQISEFGIAKVLGNVFVSIWITAIFLFVSRWFHKSNEDKGTEKLSCFGTVKLISNSNRALIIANPSKDLGDIIAQHYEIRNLIKITLLGHGTKTPLWFPPGDGVVFELKIDSLTVYASNINCN